MRGATCRVMLYFWMSSYFNPRAPCGARRGRDGSARRYHLYFNPRAPCGARRERKKYGKVIESGISIHAPHAGRDLDKTWPMMTSEQFQSTRPMRGATKNDAPLFTRA